MNVKKSSLVLSCVAALLAGCSSTPLPPAAPAPVATAAPAPAPAPAPMPAAESKVASVMLPAHLDPKSLISTDRSVYFDYDVYSIKAQYTPLIERQGKYLAANPSLAIKVEGNADERGSSEYNLALGQKRAEAVSAALKIYGAKAGQLEAVSWGKEKPKATGHDEAAWAENRRVDLVYPSK
jgi:peptidoglycan-associated lipoprotein